MTDKELNAYAANAIGLVMPAWGHCNDYGVTIDSCRDGPIYWSPLNDDGDAFRLAVKLRIEIGFDFGEDCEKVYARLPIYALSDDDLDLSPYIETASIFNENSDAELMAATRRAIVRAAAEIGKEQA